MDPNLPLILRAVLDDYALPSDGDRGISDRARVLEHGLRSADETGADIQVVQPFAVPQDTLGELAV